MTSRRFRKANPVADTPRGLSVRMLMWRKFTRNRAAFISGIFLLVLYLVTIFAGFFAPYSPRSAMSQHSFAPPTPLRFFDAETGRFFLRPFIYPISSERNMTTFQLEFTQDRSTRHHLQFFVRGESYRIMGLFEGNLHLFGLAGSSTRIYLFGTDQRGRDLFSRVLYGGQVSLSVGFLGVLIMIVMGSLIGAASGYFGGLTDQLVQRLIELLQSFPQLPLWMALSAAIPATWSPEAVYAGIVMILGMIGWTGLARELRGLTHSIKQQEFVTAAKAAGGSTGRILVRHIIPNMAGHIIVIASLAIPVTILGESALSFLGIGVKPPMVSWGLLLNDATRIQIIALHPWVLFPGLFILLTVIAFNFVGDGMRDMLDPFTR